MLPQTLRYIIYDKHYNCKDRQCQPSVGKEAALQPDQPFVEITKFPAVSRDIALLLKAEITHQEVLDAIYSAGVKRLVAVKLFDVYAGEKLGAGMKSMAYSLTFQNPNDNLTDEEVAKYMEKITKALTEKVEAEVR